MDVARAVREYLAEGSRLRDAVAGEQSQVVQEMAERIVTSLRDGGRLLICGNGGSAADAQHIAAEFVNKFYRRGRALPALALTTDTSVLTAIANDSSFDEVFSRQLEAHGRRGDCLLAISTSGSSPNVLRAAQAARRLGMTVLSLTGSGGRELDSLSDVALVVPSRETPLVQEIHIAVGHILSKVAEEALRG